MLLLNKEEYKDEWKLVGRIGTNIGKHLPGRYRNKLKQATASRPKAPTLWH